MSQTDGSMHFLEWHRCYQGTVFEHLTEEDIIRGIQTNTQDISISDEEETVHTFTWKIQSLQLHINLQMLANSNIQASPLYYIIYYIVYSVSHTGGSTRLTRKFKLSVCYINCKKKEDL
jgi:hypothetical protein